MHSALAHYCFVRNLHVSFAFNSICDFIERWTNEHPADFGSKPANDELMKLITWMKTKPHLIYYVSERLAHCQAARRAAIGSAILINRSPESLTMRKATFHPAYLDGFLGTMILTKLTIFSIVGSSGGRNCGSGGVFGPSTHDDCR